MKAVAGEGAATRIYSPDFDNDFPSLPAKIQRQIEKKLDEMGLRLAEYSHYRLTGSSLCRFRVGDYRVVYEFDVEKKEIHVLAVGRRDQIYKRL